jgi:hypothetical protein
MFRHAVGLHPREAGAVAPAPSGTTAVGIVAHSGPPARRTVAKRRRRLTAHREAAGGRPAIALPRRASMAAGTSRIGRRPSPGPARRRRAGATIGTCNMSQSGEPGIDEYQSAFRCLFPAFRAPVQRPRAVMVERRTRASPAQPESFRSSRRPPLFALWAGRPGITVPISLSGTRRPGWPQDRSLPLPSAHAG